MLTRGPSVRIEPLRLVVLSTESRLATRVFHFVVNLLCLAMGVLLREDCSQSHEQSRMLSVIPFSLKAVRTRIVHLAVSFFSSFRAITLGRTWLNLPLGACSAEEKTTSFTGRNPSVSSTTLRAGQPTFYQRFCSQAILTVLLGVLC